MGHNPMGFKSGIEIHQQLDCGKLFCDCSSSSDEKGEPDFIIKRKLRAVAGETREVDKAAAHEMLRDREFVYEGNRETSCLVELDEEPPHQINPVALETAIGIALMLNAKPVPEVQVMRKTVVDGSNTAGFQRTALVAKDGFVETDKGKIGISSICLEEDACRILGNDGGMVYYQLDRLGIPLVEIATSAEIKSGEQAMEVAKKLGIVLRAFPQVKRGLGTIRQDLNVSIGGGARSEIKGVQQLKDIQPLVENEAKRQTSVIMIRDELKTRHADVGKGIDVRNIFEKSKCRIIEEALKSEWGLVVAIPLKKFRGLLKFELFDGYRFGTELAEIAKTFGLGGLFHSDELPAYGITQDEVKRINKIFGLGSEDAFIIVSGSAGSVNPAVDAISERCRVAIERVPGETRKAEGAISVYMRPLPGAARMYPETDVGSVVIDKRFITKVREGLPKSLGERREEIEKILNKELANQIINSKRLNSFELFLNEFKVEPKLVAYVLLTAPKEFSEEKIREVVALLDEGKIAKESLEQIFEGMRKGGTALCVAKRNKLVLLNEREARKKIEEILEKRKSLVDKKNFGAIMGAIMGELRGKVDVELVKKIVGEKIK